ncbi:uncharacterized protein LOC142168984 [Nicotiana tabacum]|uniref:Uncharacterized protein LOC142168984 n=1 Tax=Nicotiana tabacum TaxID=4097 RepID=A0AC58SMT5_TOBAC
MGSLAFISALVRSSAKDVQALANRLVRFDISEPSRVLACVVSQSSLFERIKACQYDNPYLFVLKDTVQRGGAKEVSIGADGVLRLQGRVCVPNVDVLRELIREVAHSSWYFIHPGLPHTLRKFDAIWVTFDRLTKLTYSIPVMTSYTSEKLAKIYNRDIVNGVPVSIISDHQSHVSDFSSVQLDENFAYEEEPMAILDRHVQKLISKDIASLKIQ